MNLEQIWKDIEPFVMEEMAGKDIGERFCLEGDNCHIIITKSKNILFDIFKGEIDAIDVGYYEGIEEDIIRQLDKLEEEEEIEYVIKGVDFHTIIWSDVDGDIYWATYDNLPTHINYCIVDFFDA